MFYHDKIIHNTNSYRKCIGNLNSPIMIATPYYNLIRILARTFFLHNGLSHSITTVLNFYHQFPFYDFLIIALHILKWFYHIWILLKYGVLFQSKDSRTCNYVWVRMIKIKPTISTCRRYYWDVHDYCSVPRSRY